MPGIIQLFPCEVECYSSVKYGERPTTLVFGEARLEIAEILTSWRVPTGVVFHIRTLNNRTFELFYDEDSHQWSAKSI
jgi:hypothetical protein